MWERSLPAKASLTPAQALDQLAFPTVDVSSITASTHDWANSIKWIVPIANLRFAPSSWSADAYAVAAADCRIDSAVTSLSSRLSDDVARVCVRGE